MDFNRIMNKTQLKEWLESERYNYGISKGLFSLIKMRITGNELSVIWRFQSILRYTEYHTNSHHYLRAAIFKCMYNRISNKYGLHIGINVCGKNLRIMHLGSILTNDKCRMGENVALHINTAFVAQGVSNEAPTIGNNVVVGVGATIVGGVVLADGIAVGANALVNKSFFEEDIAIAGIPAKKVSDNGRSKWNKGHKCEG